MNFKTANEILGFFPDLRVLERNSQPYTLLLYQHTGSLFASKGKIGNPPNEQRSIETLDSFFQLAREENVDLAVTPEYSCPWTVIENIVSDKTVWPAPRKLWVIGMESITKQEIGEFLEKYGVNQVFIYFDTNLLKENNTFFDPLIYFFVSSNGEEARLNLLIQCKTHHMSVWSGGEVERDNIILGKEILILKNSANSISLCSFICSEAMNVPAELTLEKQNEIGWLDTPFLILNPQLNGEPTHPRFTAFRKFIMERPRKEVITLNWAADTKIGDKFLMDSGTSRSGLVINSNEIDQNNTARIRQNHNNGLYYFYFGLNKHGFLCNSLVAAYLIKTSAVDITGVVGQQSRRDGPKVTNTYTIETNKLIKSVNVPVDKSIPYMQNLACSNLFVLNDNCIIEKEILACLTSGVITKGTSEWYQIANLFSFKIDDNNEINRRLTVAEDTAPDSTANRKNYIRAINEITDIITNKKDLFPPSIIALKQKQLLLGYRQQINGDNKKLVSIEKYKYNLTTPNDNDEIIATLCYLDHPNDDEIKILFDLLQQLFDDNANKGRVVIFYKKNQQILVHYDKNAGSISTKEDYTGPSFLKTPS
jgi:hypothetical protein